MSPLIVSPKECKSFVLCMMLISSWCLCPKIFLGLRQVKFSWDPLSAQFIHGESMCLFPKKRYKNFFLKKEQIVHLPELRKNEVAVEWGGWHSILTGRRTGAVAFCRRCGIPDWRPRLSKLDKVVHQTRSEPHTYWTSLIPRPLYCRSPSAQPTTRSFCLSVVDSDTHITGAVLLPAEWLCSQK